MQKASLAPNALAAGERPESVKHYVDFLRKGRFADDAPDEVKALAIRDESLGGVLAPAEFIAEVIKGIVQFSPIRNVAKVRRTSRTSVQAPKRTGNFAAAWTGETGTRTETTGLTYGLEEIPTHELYARVVSPTGTSRTRSSTSRPTSTRRWPSSSASPRAPRSSPATPTASPRASSPTATSSRCSTARVVHQRRRPDQDLLRAQGAVLAERELAAEPAHAARHPPAQGHGQNNYVWQPGVAGGAGVVQGVPADDPRQAVHDRPDMATAASNALTAAIGDFQRAYWIVDRIEIQTLRDPYTAAGTGQVVFHARKRVGGQVVLPEAAKILKMS
jgi:predicted phage gp36 major capsid-like protein